MNGERCMALTQSQSKDPDDDRPTAMVKFLRAEVYGANGWNPRSEKTRNPSWRQIEAAIRRLDRFQYPFVWLFLAEDENESDELENTLQVMGGKGAYFVNLNAGEYNNVSLSFPDAPNEGIEVWESDQGFSASAREVTSDIELVLRIARHFADSGKPLPEAPWAAPPPQARKPFPVVGDAVVVTKNLESGDGVILYPGTAFRLIEIDGEWCSVSRTGQQYRVERREVMSIGEALARLTLAIARNGRKRMEGIPQMVVDFYTMGVLLCVKGEFDHALLAFNRALQLNPSFAPAYISRAWLRATSVDEDYRDGAEAVNDATLACNLTSWGEPGALDALAAALAESGNFAEAFQQQEKAIELAPAGKKAAYKARLALYEQKIAYRSASWLP